MNWNLVLDYVRVLIWPVIATLVAIAFRQPIRSLVSRIRKAGAVGVEVEFHQAEEVLRRADEVIEAGQNSNTPAMDSKSVDTVDINEKEMGLIQTSTAEDQLDIAEEARRIAIEEVLAEGVRLGWEYATYGESQPPRLEVTWNSGNPQIKNLTSNAALRVAELGKYREQVVEVVLNHVYSREAKVVRYDYASRFFDHIFESEEGAIGAVMELDFHSVDRLHIANEGFQFYRARPEENADRRRQLGRPSMLGVVFISRSRIPSRAVRAAKLLWGGDDGAKVKLMRWVDASDNDELLTIFSHLDRSIPPF
ncbi:hypothetical protein J5X84_41870 [Streptosporangiaceae bacterium NEAU-GS5]|nr:hypothetical protein [Streptosporangiaceae bacterium NEAU-GS5]